MLVDVFCDQQYSSSSYECDGQCLPPQSSDRDVRITCPLSPRKREPKAEDENAERETETNEDQELSSANNGPIRFPYVKDDEMPSHGTLGWDEDDEQVTALELLQGVKDGEMMLFALPSFLPIYAQNRRTCGMSIQQ